MHCGERRKSAWRNRRNAPVVPVCKYVGEGLNGDERFCMRHGTESAAYLKGGEAGWQERRLNRSAREVEKFYR
jgi:hypothetical protein